MSIEYLIQLISIAQQDIAQQSIKMNKQNLALLILVATAATGLLFTLESGSTEEALFNEWKEKLGAQFSESENMYRFNIFKQNLARINSHNAKQGRGHDEGLNLFAFLTHEEFAAQYLSKFESSNEKVTIEDVKKAEPNGPTVDWVSYGAVSPVKNQGSCTASYAFSAVGAIEGISVIFYKNQTEFSVQQLVDCSQTYGNSGCVTGNMVNSFNFVKQRGLSTWSVYPYTGALGACRVSTGTFKIVGYGAINDCNTLANALVSRPVSVAVDGNNFQLYKSGVFYNCATNLSLAVLLVGMTDAFWVLKNSWGTTWGESGYIRIARGNTCGVCQSASYPAA